MYLLPRCHGWLAASSMQAGHETLQGKTYFQVIGIVEPFDA